MNSTSTSTILIYLDDLHLGTCTYPPLFTSPSGVVVYYWWFKRVVNTVCIIKGHQEASNQFPGKAGLRIKDQGSGIYWKYIKQITSMWLRTLISISDLYAQAKINLRWFQWWISLVANMSITFFCESREFQGLIHKITFADFCTSPKNTWSQVGKLSILDYSVVFGDFQCINNANICNFILLLEKRKENVS